MIKAVRCDQPSFRAVEFTEGLNIVLADRTEESTQKDSRNGLGKSTLIEIIHFCLGGTARKGTGIFSVKVLGWTYFVDFLIGEHSVTVARNTEVPNRVTVTGPFDFTAAEISQDQTSQEVVLPIAEWNIFLGKILFDLYPDDRREYIPTFRSLMSYFIRSGKDAYTTPFEHHRKQQEWDKQVNNAFLLEMAWEDASDLQLLKDEKQALDAEARVLASRLQGNPKKLLGELAAKKVQMQREIEESDVELRAFRVHPHYREINVQTNRLTEHIHQLVNTNVVDSQLIELYRSHSNEDEPDAAQLLRIYEEAQVIFPEAVRRRVEDVQEFHRQVVRNRQSFLAAEIERLQRAVDERREQIEEESLRRATLMQILESHGALEEYNRLQQRHLGNLGELGALDSQINDIRSLEQRTNRYKIQRAQLQERMRTDYDERAVQRRNAIAIFNSNSEMIYDVQGALIIDVGDTGFRFEVIIKRDGSSGIGNMKVFCYDLTLAELWSKKQKSPGFLVHDSIIFDGVDERQVANALELAAHTSQDQGFQYICTLNSDHIPRGQFSPDFNFDQHVRIILTDEAEEKGLLGLRY